MALDWQDYVRQYIESPPTTDNDAVYTAKVLRTDATGLIARCIGVHLLEPGENTFDHHVLMVLVDQNGNSIRNARADWAWYGMSANEHPSPVVLEKLPPEPPGNLPMWKTYQAVSVSILDAPGFDITGSDTVYDLTTWFVYGEPADAGNLYHRSFLVVWQLMENAPVVEPELEPEPQPGATIDVSATIRKLNDAVALLGAAIDELEAM